MTGNIIVIVYLVGVFISSLIFFYTLGKEQKEGGDTSAWPFAYIGVIMWPLVIIIFTVVWPMCWVFNKGKEADSEHK